MTVSVLALVAVVGLWIGNVKIRGVGFGIGGVLFGGIIVGHFVDQAGVALSSPMLHFIQEFGLILFVYTIGIQVGPGFFASLRVSGLRLNLFAILIVILGGLVTAVLHKLFNIPLPVVLGIFSGAVTNTPALGAGQQILRDLGVPFEVVDQMGMSYAMAYPFGICGILLTMCWCVCSFASMSRKRPSGLRRAAVTATPICTPSTCGWKTPTSTRWRFRMCRCSTTTTSSVRG
ncbi:Mediator of hyperadherence YidE [Klebsiella pneumoniae IS46]|nr:Mediator of hyperadherence YidE [Klebsiella pneumoniae IS46]